MTDIEKEKLFADISILKRDMEELNHALQGNSKMQTKGFLQQINENKEAIEELMLYNKLQAARIAAITTVTVVLLGFLGWVGNKLFELFFMHKQ